MPTSSYDQNGLEVVVDVLKTKARHLAGVVNRNKDRFGLQWEEDFNKVLNAVFHNQSDLENATRGYISFSNDSMRQQIRFQKSREYEYKTFDEVSSKVYFDSEYMQSQYLPGLLLSHFLWPHHYAQLSYFRDQIKYLKPKSFIEIGVGTGIYSLFTLLAHPHVEGIGFDLSSSSLDFARQIMNAAGVGDRYSLHHADVTKNRISYEPDLVISVELLEHLENPEVFIRGFASTMTKRSTGFLTAALNAAHTDHIFLYSSPDDLVNQIENAGLAIISQFHEYAYEGKSRAELVPSVAAFVVRNKC